MNPDRTQGYMAGIGVEDEPGQATLSKDYVEAVMQRKLADLLLKVDNMALIRSFDPNYAAAKSALQRCIDRCHVALNEEPVERPSMRM